MSSGSTNPNSSINSSTQAASSSSFYSTAAPSTMSSTTTTTTGYTTGAAGSGQAMGNAVPIQSGTESIPTKTSAGSTTTTGLQNVAVVPDAALTRTEERVVVEQQQQVAVAVANKYVTTEHVRNTVPTVKETAVLDRQPIPESEKGAHSAEIREEHRELPLVQDRVVATKETVPVEKVKLTKEVERVDVTTDKELASYVSTEGVNVGTKTLDNTLVTEQTRTTASAMPITNSSSTTTTTTMPVSSNTTTSTRNTVM